MRCTKVPKSLSLHAALFLSEGREVGADRGRDRTRIGIFEATKFTEVYAVDVAKDGAREAPECGFLLGAERLPAGWSAIATEKIDHVRRADGNVVLAIGVNAHRCAGFRRFGAQGKSLQGCLSKIRSETIRI